MAQRDLPKFSGATRALMVIVTIIMIFGLLYFLGVI